MTREEVFEKLNTVFRDNFDDDGINLTDSTSSADIEDWDSLEQINLVVAIQDAFGIKFNIDEVNAMKNVGEMAGAILEKTQLLMILITGVNHERIQDHGPFRRTAGKLYGHRHRRHDGQIPGDHRRYQSPACER